MSVEIRELRASQIQNGDIVTEYGLDAFKVATAVPFGDAMLITKTDGTETTLDIDTVVLVERGDATVSASYAYEVQQIDHALSANGEDFLLKITSATTNESTKWLSLTREQVVQIRELFGGDAA